MIHYVHGEIENLDQNELIEFGLGTKMNVPLIIMLNKRDLPNAVSREEVMKAVQSSGLADVSILETVAIKGTNVARTFRKCVSSILDQYTIPKE